MEDAERKRLLLGEHQHGVLKQQKAEKPGRLNENSWREREEGKDAERGESVKEGNALLTAIFISWCGTTTLSSPPSLDKDCLSC